MLQHLKEIKGMVSMTIKSDNVFSITPIGGLGQIGSNMTLVSGQEESVIIDCGILFPNEDSFGVNYIIPSLEVLKKHDPKHLIITHGHEDHIGAISHILLAFPSIKVWSSPFSSELIKRKLKRDKINRKIEIFKEKDEIEFNDFSVIPIHTNHSIPETNGLLFKFTSKNVCFFLISDFKFDNQTPYEPPMDLKFIKEKTKNFEKRLLLVDSTNIKSRNTKTFSEADIIPKIENIIETNKKRIFITLFPSNIFRQKTILNACKKLKRNVIPYGKSVENYLQTAIDTNLIKENFKNIKDVKSTDCESDKNVIIISGCQGDFKGALRRVAVGEDTYFKIKKGDLFIFSSTPIPGNEKKVSQIINKIYEAGGEVITNNDLLIHSSGHAGKEDLKIIYRAFNPTDIIPIHGESSLLNYHKKFIEDSYPSAKPHLMYNFDNLVVKNNLDLHVYKNEPIENIFIHGKGIPLDKDAFRQRRKLASMGIIFISLKVDTLNRKKITQKVDFMGLPQILDQYKDNLINLINNHFNKNKVRSFEKTEDNLKVEVRKMCNQHLGYKPQVLIHFI